MKKIAKRRLSLSGNAIRNLTILESSGVFGASGCSTANPIPCATVRCSGGNATACTTSEPPSVKNSPEC